MKHLKKLLRKEEGFTLVELIVVVVIMGILAQIGLVSFNRYTRKTRAFAARTALRNIQSECEMNRDLGMDPIFTLLTPRGYSLQSRSPNSCLGLLGSGLVSAISNSSNDYPSYFYNFEKGSISCRYTGTKDNLFPECKKIGTKSSQSNNSFQAKVDDEIAKELEAEEVAKEKERASIAALETAKLERDQKLDQQYNAKAIKSKCGSTNELAIAQRGLEAMKALDISVWNTPRLGNRSQITNRSANAITGYKRKIDYIQYCRKNLSNFIQQQANAEFKVAQSQRNYDIAVRDEAMILAQRAAQEVNDPCSAQNQRELDKLVRQGRLSSTRSDILAKRCGTGQLRIELNPSIKASWVVDEAQEELSKANLALNGFKINGFQKWDGQINRFENEARQYFSEAKARLN